MAKIDENKIPQVLTFANAEETDVSTAKCGGVAYSGRSVNYYGANFIVDLAGLEIAEQVPILYNHENTPAYRLGIANISNNGKQITFDGEIDTASNLGKWLVDVGKKWKWQVSIGFNVTAGTMRYIGENEKAEVNGNEVSDTYIAGKSKLREISLCAVGADDATSLEIKMSLNDFFKLNETPKTDGGKTMADESKEQQKQTDGGKLEQFEARMNALEEQNKRFKSALDEQQKANELLKKENQQFKEQQKRPAPMMSFGGTEANASEVIEHALGVAFNLEPQKDCAAADVASKKFKHGIGIRDAVFFAAKAAGYTGELLRSEEDYSEAVRCIKFGGMTNINLPVILGNIVNKRILAGYNYVEQAWREIARIIPVNDFRDVYSVRLSAGGEFEEIPAGGQIPMGGPITENAYKNRAKTYGMSYVIDRQTIRNDDTNSISDNAFQFGRKGGLKLNDVFWSVFLNNSDFFKPANRNLLQAAGALSITSLGNLAALFDSQIDANGNPIGIDADRLLVSPENYVLAEQLFRDREIRNTTANKEYTTGNPLAGKYRPIKSRYLSNSKYTGYSADDFYLFCDPQIAATIQVCFLDGRETPYVEAFDAEFDTLGVRFRSYFDFGVTLADPNGGAKADKA